MVFSISIFNGFAGRSSNNSITKEKKRNLHSAIRRQNNSRVYLLPLILIFSFITLLLGLIYAYCVVKPHTKLASDASDTIEYEDSMFGKREDHTATSQGGTDSASNSSKDETAIFFYTLTLPVLTLMHATSELSLYYFRPTALVGKTAHIVVIAVSSLMTMGWMVTNSFWMLCELPGMGNQTICPAQTIGHFMYGIHELSIAKATIGWIVVLLYVLHAIYVGKAIQRSARTWRLSGVRFNEEDTDTIVKVDDKA